MHGSYVLPCMRFLHWAYLQSSGSRSASGSQTRKTTGPDGARDLNESGSNGESDKTSSEINIRGGSDNGSGTQVGNF